MAYTLNLYRLYLNSILMKLEEIKEDREWEIYQSGERERGIYDKEKTIQVLV